MAEQKLQKKNWKMAITEAIQSYQKNIMLLGQLADEDDFEAARKLYEVDLNLQDAITFITKKKAEAEALERERIRIAAEEAAKAQARVEAETRQVMQHAQFRYRAFFCRNIRRADRLCQVLLQP